MKWLYILKSPLKLNKMYVDKGYKHQSLPVKPMHEQFQQQKITDRRTWGNQQWFNDRQKN
jgi:hypothetical protein